MASLDLQNTLKLNILALRHEEKIDSGSFRLNLLWHSLINVERMDYIRVNFTRTLVAGVIRLQGSAPFDDILATAQAFFHEHPLETEQYKLESGRDIRQAIVEDVLRALKAPVGLGPKADKEQYFQSHAIRQCLSTQLSLFRGDGRSRSPLPAKVAEVTLRLRAVAIALRYMNHTKEDMLKPGM